ncbi:hypothetical protein [Hyphomonas johnsonii]|uniref:CHASE2 domain-containing protein n=1 Tax=Hyphomonas johnsonii MHS-2 TaxID=1280950 RepID=A0A059FG18_9PROT|nr:hypothetical protein [Hyphomonas johnsonii]KCZ89468.1 hypothetical protein HJO_14657 [Hyphomonas johnsonii MHS-2]
MALFISAIEPFGIDTAMDQHSRNILYRAFASYYGDARTNPDDFGIEAYVNAEGDAEHDLWRLPDPVDPGAPKIGQDQIVTVYLSEVVLNTMGRVFKSFAGAADPGADGDEDAPSVIDAGWQSWRPTYRDHAFLIHELVTLHEGRTNRDGGPIRPPPAMFFDFIFLENGGTAQERANYNEFLTEVAAATAYGKWKDEPASRCGTALLKVACIKANGGIPLVFARSIEVEPLVDGEEPAPAQRDLERIAILAPVRFLTEEGMYPTYTTALGHAELQQYFQKKGQRAQRRPTPAVVTYLAWCIDNANQCPEIDKDPDESDRTFKMAERLQVILDRRGDQMSLIWGSNVPRYFADMETFVTGKAPTIEKLPLFGRKIDEMAPAPKQDNPVVPGQEKSEITCYIDANPVVMLARLLFNRTSGSDMQTYRTLVQPCPYHLEVPFFTIGEGSVSDGMARAVFDGRVMIVGTRFRNSADWTPSTAHGRLPGMHQHAMALDNLITDHQDYLRGPDGNRLFSFMGIGRVDEGDVYETFVMLFVALAGVLGQFTMNRSLIDKAHALETGTRAQRRPSHWIFYIMTFGTILLIVGGALYFQLFYLRMAPLNWIGVLTLSWSFFIFLMRDEIGDDIARLLRQTPVIKRSGNAFLNMIARTARYLDMETIGFESSQRPANARAEKERIVSLLYPPTTIADEPESPAEAGTQLPPAPTPEGDPI